MTADKSIEALLRDAIRVGGEGALLRGTLSIPLLMQGFPGAVHGGALIAVCERIARRSRAELRGPRQIALTIHKPVPLETPVTWRMESGHDALGITLSQHHMTLARCTIQHGSSSTEPGPLRPWQEPQGDRWALPTTRDCLACGAENPIGCQLRLACDHRWVWSHHLARSAFRLPDGGIDPALLPVLLDECGWWLGALGTGEAGVTTEIAMTVDDDTVPCTAPIVIAGDRSRLVGCDAKGHFWRVEAAIWSGDGSPVASARVTYAASKAYSRRLVPALIELNPRESVRRVFPLYTS